MTTYTERVGLKQPEWVCHECWMRGWSCNHTELAKAQRDYRRARGSDQEIIDEARTRGMKWQLAWQQEMEGK